MFPARYRLLTTALLVVCIATSAQAENFAEAAEGPVAFRRDRLPLDNDTLLELSRELTGLAEGAEPTTAAQRRGAAQMLAVAAALDPSNDRARNLMNDFRRNRKRPDPNYSKLEKSRARVWEFISWLEVPAAGKDGQALGDCLKDVIALYDPDNPRTEALLAAGQAGAWSGWIPPLESYSGKATGAAKPDTTVAIPAVKLRKAAVSATLMRLTSQTETSTKWEQSPVVLQMTAGGQAGASGKTAPFSLVIGSSGEMPVYEALKSDITGALESVHGKLPAGVIVTVDTPSLTDAVNAGKPISINAAIAVLASAALTGQEPDATILGAVDSTGAYKVTAGFWDQLRALEKTGTGGRLVLPVGAADFLPAMLAFEKPQFFLKYEVLLAKDFKQLLELSAKTPADAVAAPLNQFADIKAKANSQTIGTYLTNAFVRRRLTEVTQAAPFHFSAKMLVIQGTGNRPTLITRAVLVSEIRQAMEPMARVAELIKGSGGGGAGLNSIYDSCRPALDGLQRYAQKEDRSLLTSAQETVALIRTVNRTNRTGSAAFDARTEFLQMYSRTMTLLNVSGQ